MSNFELSRAIDGGTISFEDGDKAANKADQYDVSRKVRVELNFSLVEGDENPEATVEYVGNLARSQVARLLGTTAPVGEVTAPATTRTRRTKAEIEAAKAAESAGTGQPGPQTSTAAGDAPTSADAASIGDEALTTADAAAIVEDWASPPAEVTDADLNAAVQKKNGTLNDPPKIRALIGSYNPDPTKVFQLREIAQERRAEFLAKLEKLS